MPERHPISVRSLAWLAFLVAGAVALAVHFALPIGSLEQSVLYELIGAASVVAILVAVRLHRPESVGPWLLVAVAQASFVAGDVLWVWFELNGETPFPSIADGFYLAGYPFLGLAFGLLIRRRLGGGDRAGLLDAAILTTGATILSWVLLIEPSIVGSEASSFELAISLAYPLADLIVIGVATGLLTTPGARTASFGLLVGGLMVLLASDEIYALQTLAGTYVSGDLLDGGWLVAYLLTAGAALHPSMREVVRPQPVTVTWLGPVRIVFLAAAMLTGPVMMLIAGQLPGTVAWVVAGASGILSLLVLTRLAGLVVTLARDVAARRALEAQLSHQANHDPLTGLANRRRFVEEVGRALADARDGGGVAVLFVDLDDFKTVNDSLGHDAGDRLLVEVAERVRSCLRTGDLASRLGGDEFGVLLEGLPDPLLAEAIADRILGALGPHVDRAGAPVGTRASIGVAFADPLAGPRSVDDLLRDADVAMYQAKADGKGRARTFASSMHMAIVERLQLRSDLAAAVARREFVVQYQPIVDVSAGTIRGFEALVRWRHPRRGLLPPAEFIGLAEETGLIAAIGRQVLEEASRRAVALARRFETAAPHRVAVNVSARQLADPGFADEVREVLATAGLDPRRLVLEITESVLARDDGVSVANLRRLRETGVRVAIDDFGTGYSSLGYVHRFPVDILKIDRSFLAQSPGGVDDGALVRLVLSVGEALGLESIAEGVERPDQATELRRLGCVLAQGFHFSRPVDGDELAALIEAGRLPIPDAAPGQARPSRAAARPSAPPVLGLEGA